MRGLLVLALVALPATTTVAAVARHVPQRESCEILEYGLYVPTAQPVRFADRGSVTGERFEIDTIEFTKHTRTIAMTLGEGFGIRYRLRDLPTHRPVDVQWRVTYPRPIRGMPGWTYGSAWSAPSGELVQHVVYDFVYDWEMVAGDWKFAVLVDGRPACSFTFRVK